MKKIKDIRVSIIKFWTQPFADFLIERLETSVDEKEFETWFTMSLHLDLYCTQKGVYLN
jgi:hypothetical protein